MIDKMLQLDPNERITCERALEHAYLKAYHDPEDEPEGSLFEDAFESQELPVEKWKGKPLKECLNVVDVELQLLYILCLNQISIIELIFNEIQTFVPPRITEDM